MRRKQKDRLRREQEAELKRVVEALAGAGSVRSSAGT